MADMDAEASATRWVHFEIIVLGAWLAARPLVYEDVTSGTVDDAVRAVTVDRGLPSVEWRASVLMASDVISGMLLMLFGAMSLSKRTAWFGQWAACFVGIWLLFAPLIFWSPRYRKSVVSGKSVSVRVDLGGGRFLKNKKK